MRIVSDTYPIRYGISDHSSPNRVFNAARIVSARHSYPIHIQYVSRRLWLPHMKINRYNGNFLHNGNTFLTFFSKRKRPKKKTFFFFCRTLWPVVSGRTYRFGYVCHGNCFNLVVSNRIHVSTYRIRRIEGLRWHIVQLWLKVMTWAAIVSFKFTGFKRKYHGV